VLKRASIRPYLAFLKLTPAAVQLGLAGQYVGILLQVSACKSRLPRRRSQHEDAKCKKPRPKEVEVRRGKVRGGLADVIRFLHGVNINEIRLSEL
jgi:hypothetical protein